MPNSSYKAWRNSAMPRAKQASKRKRGTKAVPVLGAAGLSLSLAGGASATTSGPAADMPTTPNAAPGHEFTLGEEEISDVSLATFYVFDKENTGTLQGGIQLAARGGCGGCRGGGGGGCRGGGFGGGRGCGGGCRGCGGRGCRGCGFGGCGGWGGCGCSCCLSWGACSLC
jgi:hypothetical protein